MGKRSDVAGAMMGAFDTVSRSHLLLRPMVSLVVEETDEQLLAVMEEPGFEIIGSENDHTFKNYENNRENVRVKMENTENSKIYSEAKPIKPAKKEPDEGKESLFI